MFHRLNLPDGHVPHTDHAKHRPRRGRRPLVFAMLSVATLTAVGCTQGPYMGQPGVSPWQAPTAAVDATSAQIAELSRRVQLLDDNNRQLTTQLAQREQQAQVYRDELNVVRSQLSDVTQQFEVAKRAVSSAENQVRGYQASTQLRGGATITPNTNLATQATRLNLPGYQIDRDGDVLRIVLPADQLFQPGTNQPLAQAANLLDPVAGQLKSVFPRQRVGIEGYTDNAPIYGGGFSDSHQLSSAQTVVVLDMLTRRSGLPPQQLFTVAQGFNNPRQSNDTPAGRSANRRIELVIYPETF